MKKPGAVFLGGLFCSLVFNFSLSFASYYALPNRIFASARVCLSRCLSRYISGYPSSVSHAQACALAHTHRACVSRGQLLHAISRDIKSDAKSYPHLSHARRILQEYKQREAKFQFLEENKEIIDAACDKFEQIPGFDGVIQSLCTHAHDSAGAKGYLYELEAALYLAATQQKLLAQGLVQEADIERIISFGRHKRDAAGSLSRSFDIETTRRWIECKNSKWDSQKNKKTKKQFSEQQRIAQSAHKIVYTVFSKTALSGYWRRWFDARGINYVEKAVLA